ncbi:transmembrane protein, putative (macronuclear) [Tetrahymena thermophila SB210]|uniref:Transmembrane protein, putative n=1 Tax=Tetrahymena thermophila (strain SB210) TaxID=312017 RepID=Q22SR3_TETTS|nr:transmembrane protein, putative [Tetrahymena thermophila SB210]EAR88312.2 transmembrane protein, putative [Tetrahymena thermophila SB210]|eukprot:XP_001008557.2 transmembrane protein, putative [Tetrahymena thermophila SB210]
MEESNILNGSSINFGGCLNFINTFNTNLNQVIALQETTFKQCKSNYLGGAISGLSYTGLKNTFFIECSSQIGGAIYAIQELYNIDLNQNSFEQNKAYLAANIVNKSPLKLKILEILEINQMNSNDKNLFTQTNQYLYPGLVYIIRLSIDVDGEQHKEYTNNNNFGNLYQLLVSPSQNFISQTPTQLYSINFPFILWSARDISFNGKQEIELEAIQIYLAQLYTLKESQYKIYNGCKEQGMEKVYLDKYSSTQFICQYCEQMEVSYYGVCQQCQVEYFQQCYGNYSELKSSYWRSIYSVEPQDIYYCSNNPSSCQGGSGIGNELCNEGHVGAQCLNCDLYGAYWNERFSNVGFFQCVKCNSISSNTIKIIVLLTILMENIAVIDIDFYLHQDFTISYLNLFHIKLIHQSGYTFFFILVLVFTLQSFKLLLSLFKLLNFSVQT